MNKLRPSILMYHHVEPRPFDPAPMFRGSYVSQAEFAGQLNWLVDQGFTATSLQSAVEAQESPSQSALKSVVLTFDDGCRCFLDFAVPELERRQMTATVFVVADQIGGENIWDQERGERVEQLMTGDELEDVAARGFEIGSHGLTHMDLSDAGPELLANEVGESKRRLEKLIGKPVTTFCYPYARFGPEALEAVRTAGYHAAVSTYGHKGVGPRRRYALPRAVVQSGVSLFEFKLQASGWYGLWQRLPKLGILSQLRRTRRA